MLTLTNPVLTVSSFRRWRPPARASQVLPRHNKKWLNPVMSGNRFSPIARSKKPCYNVRKYEFSYIIGVGKMKRETAIQTVPTSGREFIDLIDVTLKTLDSPASHRVYDQTYRAWSAYCEK